MTRLIINTKFSIGFTTFRGGANKTNGKFHEQQQALQELANSIYLPSAYARSLLLKYQEDFRYTEPVIFPVIKENRIAAPKTNKEKSETFIMIYPNPADNYISVDYKLTGDNGKIEIVDNIGRILISTIITNSKGTEVIDLNRLSPGIYKLSLYQDNKLIETKQFTKVK